MAAVLRCIGDSYTSKKRDFLNITRRITLLMADAADPFVLLQSLSFNFTCVYICSLGQENGSLNCRFSSD